MKINYHFVREHTTTQQLFVSHIYVEDQIANIFSRLATKLNVRHMHLPLSLLGDKWELSIMTASNKNSNIRTNLWFNN